jgi:hypothetical protein
MPVDICTVSRADSGNAGSGVCHIKDALQLGMVNSHTLQEAATQDNASRAQPPQTG